MKAFHFLCLFLICSQAVEGKAKAVLSMITTAWDLISMSIDIGKLIEESVDGDLSDKIDEVVHAINDFMKYVTIQISTIKDLIRKEAFLNYVRRLRDDIENCIQESKHLKVNLHVPGMKENLWNQCKDIINPLRALGKILTGQPVINKSSLMEYLREKEGFCKGATMDGVFSYFFRLLSKGCAAFVIAQRSKHGNISSIYEDEFRRMFNDIKIYMTKIFEECSIQICSLNSQPKVKDILKSTIFSLNGTIIELHQQFPYLKFVILQVRSDTSDYPRPVNHSLYHMEVPCNGGICIVYALKYHKVSNEKGPFYKLVEYSPSDMLDHAFSDDMKVDNICEEGMSRCAFKIYANSEDAGCFHDSHTVSTANVLSFSPLVFILSISIGILSFMW